ncbi:MAG: hypothetical protein GY760_24100 [Deltaproteobacteria bacterium]|nr:hypothetical protein [Deltaproteobacteria bacterium]
MDNKSYLIRFGIYILLSFLVLSPIYSQTTNEKKSILVIFAYDTSSPWQKTLTKGLETVFNSEKDISIKYFYEYANLNQIEDNDYLDSLFNYYYQKWNNIDLDLIIFAGSPILDYIPMIRERINTELPVCLAVAAIPEYYSKKESNMAISLENIDFKKALDTIISIQGDIKNIYVVSGVANVDKIHLKDAKSVFSEYEKLLNFQYLTGLSEKELIERTKNLPENSIVFYILTVKDKYGTFYTPKDVVSSIASTSNIPVYGLWDSFMGTGVVGGFIGSGQRHGEKTGDQAIQILKGEKPSNMEIEKNTNAFIFDWNQLNRWQINEKRLPSESIILYRDSTFFELYKKYIIGVFILLLLEGVLILFLLLNRYKRIQAETELRRINNNLEQSVAERTFDLKKSNTELTDALSNIKTLKGLVPICSNCKKIRDDKGFWNQLEGFIENHSDAMFSHGLCPDCETELYGDNDWYKRREKKKEDE